MGSEHYVGSYLWSLRQTVGSCLLLVPGVQILLLDQGRKDALFQRRAENGIWEIPAGSCEPTGGFVRAALAEVREKTGLEVDSGSLTPFATISDPSVHTLCYPNGDLVHAFALCFFAITPLNARPNDTDEAIGHRFFPIDRPPRPLHGPTQLALDRYLAYVRSGRFQAD